MATLSDEIGPVNRPPHFVPRQTHWTHVPREGIKCQWWLPHETLPGTRYDRESAETKKLGDRARSTYTHMELAGERTAEPRTPRRRQESARGRGGRSKRSGLREVPFPSINLRSASLEWDATAGARSLRGVCVSVGVCSGDGDVTAVATLYDSSPEPYETRHGFLSIPSTAEAPSLLTRNRPWPSLTHGSRQRPKTSIAIVKVPHDPLPSIHGGKHVNARWEEEWKRPPTSSLPIFSTDFFSFDGHCSCCSTTSRAQNPKKVNAKNWEKQTKRKRTKTPQIFHQTQKNPQQQRKIFGSWKMKPWKMKPWKMKPWKMKPWKMKPHGGYFSSMVSGIASARAAGMPRWMERDRSMRERMWRESDCEVCVW